MSQFMGVEIEYLPPRKARGTERVLSAKPRKYMFGLKEASIYFGPKPKKPGKPRRKTLMECAHGTD